MSDAAAVPEGATNTATDAGAAEPSNTGAPNPDAGAPPDVGTGAPSPDVGAGAPPPAAKPEAPADWRAALPEDLQAEPSLLDYKGEVNEVLPKLAKSLVHAQKLVGMDRQKLAVVPSEDAGEEAWNEFYTKMGRPETADAYQLPVDKIEFNDQFQRNEDMENWYKETSHKYGLSGKQAAGLYQDFMAFARGATDKTDVTLEQMNDQAVQSLKQEWGAAYQRKMDGAVNVLRNYASEEFVDLLDRTGLGSHPEMSKMLAAIADASGEDTLTDKSKTVPVMTPGEASAAIAQKQNDKDFMKAYSTKNHPSHEWAVGEMSRLYRFATAGASQAS